MQVVINSCDSAELINSDGEAGRCSAGSSGSVEN